MAQDAPFLDMLEKFGADLGLPKVDVDKLVDVQRKNLDALAKSAQIASKGAQSLATKQKEIAEAAFYETVNLVREFEPTGTPQEILAKQTELARKAFNAAIDNTQDIVKLIEHSNVDALKLIEQRIKGSITEIRESFERAGDAKKSKR